jgi:hypothetical protein
MYTAIFILTSILLAAAAQVGLPQEGATERPPDDQWNHALFYRVVENQKKNDAAMDLYERIERVESRKTNGDNQTTEVKTSRVVPAGTGAAHLPVGPDGQAVDATAYRVELEKLEKSLVWAVDTGRAQHDAYEKIAKKRKEREDLIGAARTAFIFTFLNREERGGRILLKYRMTPNPTFKPTTRSTSVYTKGLFLARVYKGSHFMQERYEMAPGLWLPTFSQYDFDGRKFFASFSVHDRTFYSNYRLVGTPKEALELVRTELKQLHPPITASP